MAFRMNYGSSTLHNGLDKMGVKMGAMILMYSSTKAVQLESKAKKERPWTDRTGMAKALLNAKVSKPNDHTIRITLAHGVDYGIWLELAHEKNYAIVGPIIRNESPKVMSEMANLMSKIKL